jgi:tetratricopeptide (TPR) repeat protein
VFFSRITLVDKLGTAYEPYIFSALNSAKVMLVVGTKPEHLNSVWVKNEWSRFLALMKKDKSKVLIPCYQDMDAYDLPEQLSYLQSQDMSKIGFLQDLIRGVQKVLDAGKEVPKAQAASGDAVVAPGVASLYKRMTLFLENEEWKQADEYAERILDIDPEFAPAYVGKLCVELKAEAEDMLTERILLNSKEEASWIDSNRNYKNAIRFADDAYRARVEGYRNAAVYAKASELMENESYGKASEEFGNLSNYRDSEEKAKKCFKLEESLRNDYEAAIKLGESAKRVEELKYVAKSFSKLGGYKDSTKQVEKFEQLARERKDNMIASLVASLIALGLAIVIVIYSLLEYQIL